MPKKISKRLKKALEMLEAGKSYSIAEAAELLGKFPKAKFDESVEIAFRMTIDPRKTDQMIRGTVRLPHGSGKEVKVLVFAKEGEAADAAKEAGAEYVGFDEYIEKVTSGWTDFDVAVATPEAMTEVRKLGRVLGPRGLMPNPKTGTVTDDTAKAVKEVKAGRVEYKLDKGANIQVLAGKASFSSEQIIGNIKTIIDEVIKAKPSAAKGRYIDNCVLSSSMSPGIPLDLREVLKGL
ncbi:MAG: 50S ribosomal protein L1 [Verrucomicrobiales bacterium]|jgi:large subunit ribosomal protein L1|nr:50S ribosomal protein L1 [Verrucomicrobiales bacterium]|tara:strand:+ start:110 stop:817 length:708 start_codon:yes stop_codon:yes gene_type:complete